MEEEIKKTCEILRQGGVILYPTDTVWGIGCDATNEKAVRRIYEIKKRSDAKSMLVLLGSASELEYYVDDVPNVAFNLIEVADKPLTVIYSNAKNVAQNIISDDGSLGIRITNEEFSQKLCRKFRNPIVSTSANISGEPAPDIFSKINDEIIRSVDYVVNYRREDNHSSRPSSIIKIGAGGLIQIIRE
ncbi:MAG: threonylcarbamoyl-AMP synthase [Dysgonamonadaceae bacterium]|jgi:L-threonylcarbamoyladenylate synthase|nr:threonylcarbamoyl-AMP synthase [Dysgonamonadaceae bacterium]